MFLNIFVKKSTFYGLKWYTFSIAICLPALAKCTIHTRHRSTGLNGHLTFHRLIILIVFAGQQMQNILCVIVEEQISNSMFCDFTASSCEYNSRDSNWQYDWLQILPSSCNSDNKLQLNLWFSWKDLLHWWHYYYTNFDCRSRSVFLKLLTEALSRYFEETRWKVCLESFVNWTC